ncbi:MAG: Fe-S cluster assembly protein SufD [Ilumatobacteraceae bacterium]
MNATPLMPSTDEEIWRYSRIGELDMSRYSSGAVRTETLNADAIRVDRPLAGTVMQTPVDVFAEMNAASPQEIALVIPKGRAVENTVEIVHHLETDGTVAWPRLVIDAGEDSEVTVVERFVSNDSVVSLVVPVLEVRAARSARVNYVAVNQLGTRTWQIGHQQAVGHRDSTIRLNTVALGGDYARVRAEARLVEQGANAQQLALYFASGTQMHDFRTLQHHVAPRTHSDLLFKGAVGGSARSVYTGLIHIAKNAAHSEAFQTNRNLTLGEGAWAESVPNLEIETNEVKCSHASTVGSIEDDHRFYLESRGVPPEVAERLIVFGFFNDVLDRMPRGVDVEPLRRAVADKLAAEAALTAGAAS